MQVDFWSEAKRGICPQSGLAVRDMGFYESPGYRVDFLLVDTHTVLTRPVGHTKISDARIYQQKLEEILLHVPENLKPILIEDYSEHHHSDFAAKNFYVQKMRSHPRWSRVIYLNPSYFFRMLIHTGAQIYKVNSRISIAESLSEAYHHAGIFSERPTRAAQNITVDLSHCCAEITLQQQHILRINLSGRIEKKEDAQLIADAFIKMIHHAALEQRVYVRIFDLSKLSKLSSQATHTLSNNLKHINPQGKTPKTYVLGLNRRQRLLRWRWKWLGDRELRWYTDENKLLEHLQEDLEKHRNSTSSQIDNILAFLSEIHDSGADAESLLDQVNKDDPMRLVYEAIAFLRNDFESLVLDRELHEFELRKAKETLEASNTLKSQLLTHLSHELRTPLNGVLGMSGILLETDLDDHQQIYAHAVRESADSLLNTVQNVLDFSDLNARQLKLRETDFELLELIESTCDPAKFRAADKNLEMRWVLLPERLRNCHGDFNRISQIINHILDNAIKFTDNGFIEVVFRTKHEQMLGIDIKDTGIGMPPDKIRKLFEPFEQVDQSLSRKQGGIGLGLAIAKQLVEAMNGRISVQSSIDRGSIFTIELPILTPEMVCPNSIRAIDQHLALRILLVEDNLVNQQVGLKTLKKLGHQCIIAKDGIEALEVLNDQSFDLVLMDIQMPRMDGLEATRQWRQMEQIQNRPRLPILALSAHVLSSDHETCFAAGMDECLSKPINLTQLQKAFSCWANAK